MDQISRDQQILERLRTNDQRAWREIYEGNRSKVINYLRRYSTPDSVAVEIYQDTLVFLDERKDTLQLTSKLSTYLIGVAFNKLRALWKSDAGKFKTIDLMKLSEGDNDDELNQMQIELVEEPRFGADSDEPDAMIQQALAQVQLKHCTDLFRLVYYEERDQREVANTLGMSYGSVRNQLLDCKKKMKTILLDMGWVNNSATDSAIPIPKAMTEEERDELIEKSLLNALDPADESRVQQLRREDESFRQEYEFQEKLIQQVRLKNRQDLKSMFTQFEADYQASAPENEESDTPVIPLTPRRESDETASGPPVIPLWQQNWFRVAALLILVAGIVAVIWFQKYLPDPNPIADDSDSTRNQTKKDTQRKDPAVLPKLPNPLGPVAQNPTTPTPLSGPVRLPYYETDDVSLGFGQGQKTDEYRTVLFLTGAESIYEFQDTLKVYFPTRPPAKPRWELVYSRADDSYYLITGTTRYEIIKGLKGRQPLKKSN